MRTPLGIRSIYACGRRDEVGQVEIMNVSEWRVGAQGSLGGQLPSRDPDVQPSGRRYQPRPPAWDYPAGHLVLRVDHTGSIRYRGRRYFVCQALEDEWVGCQGFDHQVLVTFRRMHVREIDVRSGQTRPVLWRTD